MVVTVERRGRSWFASVNREEWIELFVPHGRADEALAVAKLMFEGWMVVVRGPRVTSSKAA